MTSDQVPDAAKTAGQLLPGLLGRYGLGLRRRCRHRDRQPAATAGPAELGTDFFVDPDGTVGVLLTQVELGDRVFGMIEEFQALPDQLVGQPR